MRILSPSLPLRLLMNSAEWCSICRRIKFGYWENLMRFSWKEREKRHPQRENENTSPKRERRGKKKVPFKRKRGRQRLPSRHISIQKKGKIISIIQSKRKKTYLSKELGEMCSRLLLEDDILPPPLLQRKPELVTCIIFIQFTLSSSRSFEWRRFVFSKRKSNEVTPISQFNFYDSYCIIIKKKREKFISHMKEEKIASCHDQELFQTRTFIIVKESIHCQLLQKRNGYFFSMIHFIILKEYTQKYERREWNERSREIQEQQMNRYH